MVHQLVHVPTQKLGITIEAEQPQGGRIRERALAFEIDPVDPLTRRLQQRSNQFSLFGEQLFVAPPLADVHESEHAPHQLAVALHRVGPILGWKGSPVLAEHDLVIHVRPLVLPERAVDTAFLHRVRLSVGARVVHQLVHVPTQELCIVLEAEQPQAGGVRERAAAVQIDAIDPLTRRLQQQPSQLVADEDVLRRRLTARGIYFIAHRTQPFVPEAASVSECSHRSTGGRAP